MRRNKGNQMMAILLAAGMLCGLTACGGGEQAAPAPTETTGSSAQAESGNAAAEGELVAEEGAEIEVAYW